MNKFRFTIQMLAVATFLFAAASMTQAQATRTWVSGVGDDVNPCSRTAPCKTWAGAISKTADGGEIDALDPGGFGTVTITKSITIDGTTGAGFGSTLSAGTTGVNVNDSGSGAPMTKIVRLRNLSINGAGTGTRGVNYTSGKAVYVENCIIQNIKAAPGHGILANLTADGGQVFVRDTLIEDCAGDAIQATTTVGGVRVECDNVRVNRAVNGYHVLGSSALHLNRCSASANSADGVKVEGSSSAVINHSFLQSNTGIGLNAVGGSTRISDVTIVNNFGGGINLAGGTVFTFLDNIIRSNAGVGNIAGGSLNGSETKQ